MSTSIYRQSIISLLGSLAELDPKIGPTELCCMWFDDLYRPGERNPERYNPGVWDRGLWEWQSEFGANELKLMAEFHAVFEAECDAWPTEWPDWDKDPGWHRVRDAARIALKQIVSLSQGPNKTDKKP